MLRLPCLAHKAPVMQATQVITHQALNSNNRCVGTASPWDQNLILLLKAMIKYILMLYLSIFLFKFRFLKAVFYI